MYKAFVTRIKNIRKHSNADRLMLATVLGNQVIIGLDVCKENDLVIFFPSDGKLSLEYCNKNDLIPRFDENGKRINSGFIDPPNLRVRAQNFRGERSEGLIMPLESVAFTGIDLSILVEGFSFTDLNGINICSKYETLATIRSRNKIKDKKASKSQAPLFLKHVDTEQFKYYVDSIPENSLITVTEKLHGTSGRISNTLIEKEITPRYIPSFLKRFFRKKITKFEQINGTRNVVLFPEDRNVKKGFYENDAFRWYIYDQITLQKFETIYFEIIGWVNSNSKIQPSTDTTKLKDSDFTNKYGTENDYSYGCPVGSCRVLVYRITQTNEDGHVIELSWNQVKRRCRELGIEHVPEVIPQFLYTCDKETLVNLVNVYSEGSSLLNEKTWREGLIIRIDTPLGETLFLKEKNFYFKVMEGIVKNTDEYVDLEEAS